MRMIDKLSRFCIFCCALMLLAGCGLIHVRNDQTNTRDSSVIIGRITADYPLAGPIFVGAWRDGVNDAKPTLVEYSMLDASGSYVLLVPPGSYRIIAFEDANHSFRIDASEAASAYSSPVRLEKNAMAAAIDISLKRDSRQDFLAAETPIPSDNAKEMQSSRSGAVADLSSQFFSEAYATDTAYWEGLRFFREGGGNIFFLEPYDPQRIPVLFVHGARGSPQDWIFAFRHLDTKRYQPCFFYYPTSSSLADAANLLRMKLLDLQQEHFIPRMHIVAHSAGGLVVHDFLRRYGEYHPYIDTFISISTPWGGEPLAQFGVKHSPVVLPSWVDMQPTSDFFAQLYQKHIPASIGYYLLFGYRGGVSLRANNDGAILMESLLDPRAQVNAREVRGFNESHVSILRSKEVFSEVGRILKERDTAYHPETAGILSLKVQDASVLEDIDSMTSLVLEDAQGRTRSMQLPQKAQTSLANVPAGEYRLRVRSLRIGMRPDELRVMVQPGGTTTAVLPLRTRQGSICGVALKSNVEYATVGLKAAVPVNISRVTLHGPGVVRTIDMHYASPDEAPLAQDFITPGLFCFVDLPNGDYSVNLHTASGIRDLTTSLPVKGWTPLMVYF